MIAQMLDELLAQAGRPGSLDDLLAEVLGARFEGERRDGYRRWARQRAAEAPLVGAQQMARTLAVQLGHGFGSEARGVGAADRELIGRAYAEVVALRLLEAARAVLDLPAAEFAVVALKESAEALEPGCPERTELTARLGEARDGLRATRTELVRRFGAVAMASMGRWTEEPPK